MDIPATDEGHHFFLSYHIKGVCNIHCCGRHSPWTLSQGYFVRIMEWRDRFYVADVQLLVEEFSTPVGTVVIHTSSLSGSIQHTRRTHGG